MVYKVNDGHTGYLIYSVGSNSIDSNGQNGNACGNYFRIHADCADSQTYAVCYDCYPYANIYGRPENGNIEHKRNYTID